LKVMTSRLKETIASQEQEVSTKETTLAALQETWKGFLIYPHTAEIPAEQKATWLAQQFQDTKARQKGLQQQVQSYVTKKQELDVLQNSINDLERRQNENNNA